MPDPNREIAERAHAALKEIGVDTWVGPDPHGEQWGLWWAGPINMDTADKIWRAYIVAGSKVVPCMKCWRFMHLKAAFAEIPCHDRGDGTTDCGLDRYAWLKGLEDDD